MITIQKQSQTGMQFFHFIRDAYYFYKEDNYVSQKTNTTSYAIVVIKKNGTREYIHSFYHKEIRNEVFEILKTQENVMIPLIKFRHYGLSKEEVRDILTKERYSIRYLEVCLTKASRMSGLPVERLDAVAPLPKGFTKQLSSGNVIITKDPEELSQLWGATLSVPKTVLFQGVTPEQFFKHLIEKCV